MQKLFVKRPARRQNSWVVATCESKSPLAKEIEVFTFSSREAAYQCYRHIRKEMGLGL